jgi:hypothetical protein
MRLRGAVNARDTEDNRVPWIYDRAASLYIDNEPSA